MLKSSYTVECYINTPSYSITSTPQMKISLNTRFPAHSKIQQPLVSSSFPFLLLKISSLLFIKEQGTSYIL